MPVEPNGHVFTTWAPCGVGEREARLCYATNPIRFVISDDVVPGGGTSILRLSTPLTNVDTLSLPFLYYAF